MKEAVRIGFMSFMVYLSHILAKIVIKIVFLRLCERNKTQTRLWTARRESDAGVSVERMFIYKLNVPALIAV